MLINTPRTTTDLNLAKIVATRNIIIRMATITRLKALCDGSA